MPAIWKKSMPDDTLTLYASRIPIGRGRAAGDHRQISVQQHDFVRGEGELVEGGLAVQGNVHGAPVLALPAAM